MNYYSGTKDSSPKNSFKREGKIEINLVKE